MQVEREVAAAISSRSNVSETLTHLLSTCSGDSAEPQRRAIFQTSIAALDTGESLQALLAKEVIGTLLFEVHACSCCLAKEVIGTLLFEVQACSCCQHSLARMRLLPTGLAGWLAAWGRIVRS